MFTRAFRAGLVIVLLLVAVGASAFAWILEQRARDVSAADDDIAAHVERLLQDTADLATSQLSYVAPGQPPDSWSKRVSTLHDRISADAMAMTVGVRSPEARRISGAVTEAVTNLARIDARVRERLGLDDILGASDLVFSDAHAAIDRLQSELRTLRDAEHDFLEEQRSLMAQQRLVALAGTATTWCLGLMLLVRSPRGRDPAMASVPAEPPDGATLEGATVNLSPAVDFSSVAEACVAISRLGTNGPLPDVLARAAVTLDATGVAVWKVGGDGLETVAAHGYDAHLLDAFGPIPRAADNAAAAAWRTGVVQIVAGDRASCEAIVAPIHGPEGCRGVFTAELRPGRHADENLRAAMVLLASQLASTMPAGFAGADDDSPSDLLAAASP